MNREITDGSPNLYPLQGDVQSTPGNTQARVIGLQGVAVSPTAPNPGDVLTYGIDNQWEPAGSSSAVFVNGEGVSADYLILQNGTLAFGTELGVEVNGTPVD